MSNTVKIKRGSEEAEVLSIYLQDFLDDGWHEVSAAKSKTDNAKDLKETNERNEKEQQERDILVAQAVEAKEEEHKQAVARIQAELDEFRRKEADAVDKQLLEAAEETNKRHEQKLLVLDDKDQIADYVNEHFGKDLDKRGSVDVVREKAINIVHNKA